MKKVDIILAWKNATYRESLTEEQRALIPANPAGMLELTDTDLASISGGVYQSESPGTTTGTGGGTCSCSTTGTGVGSNCNCSC